MRSRGAVDTAADNGSWISHFSRRQYRFHGAGDDELAESRSSALYTGNAWHATAPETNAKPINKYFDDDGSCTPRSRFSRRSSVTTKK